MNRTDIGSSMSPSRRLGMRPYCGCCAGGERRKGKRFSKAASHSKNVKNGRAKPRYKDHR